MKKLNYFTHILLIIFVLTSCSKDNNNSEIIPQYSFVDKSTPLNSKPLIIGSTTLDKWKLDFSDEFNDIKMDTLKWNTENRAWYKGDINVFSTGKEVEEKDGNMYLNYFKSTAAGSKDYFVGRINSRDKYSTTYGFFETKMHVVKPNGYQTAFWLMPNSGLGMSNAGPAGGHDGTAADGAEIDIIEGNKLNSYSCGLHWDGYDVDHKGAGNGSVSAVNMHNTEYHVFGLEWSKTYLKYYFNGRVVWQTTDPKAIAHVPEYILLSGMCWGVNTWVNGDVTKNTFIQNGGVDKAYIDYVRVFKFTP